MKEGNCRKWRKRRVPAINLFCAKKNPRTEQQIGRSTAVLARRFLGGVIVSPRNTVDASESAIPIDKNMDIPPLSISVCIALLHIGEA